MVKKALKSFAWFSWSFVFLLYACNDFDEFGSDLLDDDWIHAKGVDTFHFTASASSQDSIITFKNFSFLGASNFIDAAFPLGKYADPLFGNVEAGFGTQLRVIATTNFKFLQLPVDSVIISLRYDTSLFYGVLKESMDFKVFALTDPYNSSATYYSNHVLDYDQNVLLGSVTNHFPNAKDSIEITRFDTVKQKLFPQLRISMDTQAVMQILRNYSDSVYSTLDSFSKVFNGIAVVCSKGNGMVSVLPEHGDSKMTIYFKDSTGASAEQEFNMGLLAVKTPVYQVDNQNSIAGQCIDGSISGDSLICLQGLTGRDIRLSIPYDSSWNGKFINFAVLQFYVAELPGDSLKNYSLPELLEIFDVSTGTKVAIEDVQLAFDRSYRRVFGGEPIQITEQGKSIYTYKMNITRHFQKSQKARKSMELVISSLFKLESPARLVFLGQGNGQFPAKLILTYSE